MLDSAYEVCDYIGIEGHSRIFIDGKIKPEVFEHKCDCFRDRKERTEQRNVWRDGGRLFWEKHRKENIPIVSDVEDD